MNYCQNISLIIRFNYIYIIQIINFFIQLYDNKYTTGNTEVHDLVLDYVDAPDNKSFLLLLTHSSS
jgi:hypothetical protein